MMRTDREFRALLVLLGDEQESVASAAREALSMERDASVPYLEEASLAREPLLRGRARLLLEELRLGTVEGEWDRFAVLPDAELDLERGCLLLSRLGGETGAAGAGGFLDAISGMVRAHLASVGGLQALTEVLFDNLGFRGGDFGDPRCHYLTGVLDRRVGIPISLATVYVLVGRRLGLPVSGVAMPGHYLARFERPDGPLFVDCYNRGRLYKHETLVDVLAGKGIQFTKGFLAPSGARFTLHRKLNNLENLYRSAGNDLMEQAVGRWRAALGARRKGAS